MAPINWQQFAAIDACRCSAAPCFFVIVISLIFAFQTVEQLQALGEGGPNDSANLLLYLIFQNISERRNWGYVNAMTIVLIGVVLSFTISNFLLFERDESELMRESFTCILEA